MSGNELDADLYGDLYGDGDTSALAPAAAPQATRAQAPAAAAPAPATAPATASKAEVKPEQNFSSIPSYQSDTGDMAPGQHIPSYADEAGEANQYEQQANANAERSVRPSEMKDEGKMFIGGLNWETSDDSLRNYFSQFGKVDACTIMRDQDGRSRCFAFLTFEEPASVNAVMVREHFLDGKIIDPKRAVPRSEHQRATKLFIGGLAGSVTSESMREFFSQFGKVVDSTVMLDRETGRSKGFGFISFEDTDVTPFLGFGQLEIDGKLIDVKLAQPRAQRDADGGTSVYGPHGSTRGRGGGFTGGRGGSHMGAASPTGAHGNMGGMMGSPAANMGGGGTAFDPQALANLYTRMFQMGAVNPMMGMGMGMGMGRGMMGGMGMGGMGAGMGAGMGGAGMGGGVGVGGGMGMNMGMGRGGQQQGGAGMAGVPRGPRAAAGGPGPQRTGQRGHGYHPYAR